MTTTSERESSQHLAELERLAYINGDRLTADLLAKLADRTAALEPATEMYWALRECFPVQSSMKKEVLLEKLAAIWDQLERHEEYFNDLD